MNYEDMREITFSNDDAPLPLWLGRYMRGGFRLEIGDVFFDLTAEKAAELAAFLRAPEDRPGL